MRKLIKLIKFYYDKIIIKKTLQNSYIFFL